MRERVTVIKAESVSIVALRFDSGHVALTHSFGNLEKLFATSTSAASAHSSHLVHTRQNEGLIPDFASYTLAV